MSDSSGYIDGARIKRIHVNQHVIKANKKAGACDPALTIKVSGSPAIKASRCRIHGSSEVVYSPDKPLSCGAVCWVETKGGVAYW